MCCYGYGLWKYPLREPLHGVGDVYVRICL